MKLNRLGFSMMDLIVSLACPIPASFEKSKASPSFYMELYYRCPDMIYLLNYPNDIDSELDIIYFIFYLICADRDC